METTARKSSGSPPARSLAALAKKLNDLLKHQFKLTLEETDSGPGPGPGITEEVGIQNELRWIDFAN